jgi:hypothetical protein
MTALFISTIVTRTRRHTKLTKQTTFSSVFRAIFYTVKLHSLTESVSDPLNSHNQESSVTHTRIYKYVHTNITHVHTQRYKHVRTRRHKHTQTQQPDIALSNVTHQTGGLRSIHWNGRNLFEPPPPEQPWSQVGQSVSVIFPWGLSNRRTKLTSHAQFALIVRICGVSILIPHLFWRRGALWPV